RPVPPGAAGPGILQRRAPALRAHGAAWPRRGGGGAAAGRGHRAAGARVRRRRQPLRAGPGEGAHGSGRDPGTGRQPRAEGRGRLRRTAPGRAAPADPGADLHAPRLLAGAGARPVSRAAARRGAGGAGSHSLEAAGTGPTDVARGFLRGALAGGAVRGTRVAGAAMTRITVDLRETVIAIARQAGEAIMEIYREGFEVTHKQDASPLTAADMAAHRIIVEGLQRLTPELPVLSEESAEVPWEVRRLWQSYWLVDPLDGTREFVKRNDEFSVNIALVVQGAPVLGVVQAPVGGQVWHAVRGEAAYRRDGQRDEPLRVRSPASAPLRVAASRSHRDARTQAVLDRMGEIEEVALGSSLKFCRIAEGRLDVYPRFGPTSEWDTAAGQCVLHAAGGALLAADTGKPFRYNRRETLLNGDFIALGDTDPPWQQWL